MGVVVVSFRLELVGVVLEWCVIPGMLPPHHLHARRHAGWENLIRCNSSLGFMYGFVWLGWCSVVLGVV